MPVGTYNGQDQKMTIIYKDAQGKMTFQKTLGVYFVALTDKEKQCPELFPKQKHKKQKYKWKYKLNIFQLIKSKFINFIYWIFTFY